MLSNTVARLIISVTLVAFQVTVDGFESNYAKRKCPQFQIKKRTIIKTQASKANGAIYLETSTVASSHRCYDLCCENANCNMVLLKYDLHHEKRVTCYMFNCGSPSKCLFHTHSSFTNYVALLFDDREVEDSISPATQHQYFQKEATTEEVTSSLYPHMDHDRNKEYPWQSKDAKTTEESKNVYHEITTPAPSRESDHIVKTNNEGNWLNKNLGKILTTQYMDYDNGKDIFTTNQEASIHKSFVTTKAPIVSLDGHQGTQKETSQQGYDGSESTFDHTHMSSHGKVNPNTSKHPKDKTPEDDGSFGKYPEEEDFERRVWLDKNPNYPEKPKKVAPSKKPMSTNTPTKASTKNQEASTKSQETQSSFIINRFNIQQNKAVIPLAVGLIIALLLLMAVVFRMRTSRRRRTKAFLTDDADYLINGMYL